MARALKFPNQRNSLRNRISNEVSWSFLSNDDSINSSSNSSSSHSSSNSSSNSNSSSSSNSINNSSISNSSISNSSSNISSSSISININSNNSDNTSEASNRINCTQHPRPAIQHPSNDVTNHKTNACKTRSSNNNGESRWQHRTGDQQQQQLQIPKLTNSSSSSNNNNNNNSSNNNNNKQQPFPNAFEAAKSSACGFVAISVSRRVCDSLTDAAAVFDFISKLLQAARGGNNGSGSGSSNRNNSIHLSQFYVAILVTFYCCILIRATAATSTNNSSIRAAADSNDLKTHPAFLLNVTADRSVSNKSSSSSSNSNDLVTLATQSPAADNQLHQRLGRDAANVPGEGEDDSSYHDEFDEYEALINNKSAKGKYIGAPCDGNRCESTLLHVLCDKETQLCGCEKNYPVQLGLTKGCAKPKKLGEQCFYDETCIYNDENSLCVQVRHNALCQCARGFHSVSYAKPTRRVFCTQDLKEIKSDLPTLLGVSSGIAVLAGLICMVLHLFSKTKYPRHRNFGDANLPPPIMYSNETGIPLTVQSGRPSSRSSLRSSGSIGSYGNRRSSATMQSSSSAHAGGGGVGGGGGKGILVSTSRTGSRRPSLASVHSTSSSVRSYSMMRFEKETQQKEIRQEMKLRLARLQQQQQLSQNKPQIVIGDTMLHHHGALARMNMSTPSPLTPNSLDELLPSVDETLEFLPLKTEPSTILAPKFTTVPSNTNVTAVTTIATTTNNSAYVGPCSSSTEEL